MSWLSQFDNACEPTRAQHRPHKYPPNSTFGLVTQNTRGFRDDTRRFWMAAWKAQIDGTNINYILIQETHVGTTDEARSLQEQWAQAWGKQHDPDRPLSFWSVAATSSIGVAILIRPHLLETFVRVSIGNEQGRVLAIGSEQTTIINIYAPNDRASREVFFAELDQALVPRPGKLLLAGDFNCVLNPTVDRVSTRPTLQRAESPALVQLLDRRRLLDTAELHAIPSPQTQSTTALTFFQAQSGRGARLDRCYIAADWTAWVTGTTVTLPKVHSDHLAFVTWLRDPRVQPRSRPLAPLLYPIYGRFPEVLEAEIQEELSRIFYSHIQNQRSWDDTLRHVEDALRAIKKREKRRARRAVLNWERRLRRRIHTREEMIDYEHGRLVRQMERRHGARLLKTVGAASIHDRLGYQPRQVITDLDGPAALAIADKFGTAWAHLLAASHAACEGEEQRRRFEQLLTIPPAFRLNAQDNQALTQDITSEEVEATIAELGAHKAGGADRLNNDFYKAWAPIVAPALASEFNRIVQGGTMPPSFTEAIIVPLPKKGNSSNAMDYRPISLLQSSYKILTKLLAARVQRSLGRVINADQNGFVRGRDMANNIFLMQALLSHKYSTPDNTAAAAPVAVLLDFKKAYDTLDRGFLNLALEAFGYDTAFISLVTRLHENTSARFLANGDLSESLDVRTGIRQGCPLAPLLFLVAVETLKYAIEQTPGVHGIELSRADHTFLHGFSAFVDDSVVFVAEGQMLTGVEETLRQFATVSGLHVQPTKSHAIVMNPQCSETSIGAFPIVPAGATAPYLGTEVGLGDTTEANWAARLGKLHVQLGKASTLTTSLHDRVVVLNTIGLPAILFTAKFSTPSPAIITEIASLWRQYVWRGTITTGTIRAHPIAPPVLHLKRDEMGIGLRDFREAMVDQAARTVLAWNTRTHDKYWAAIHVLLQAASVSTSSIIQTYPSSRADQARGQLDGKTPLLRLGLQRVNAALVGRYPVPTAVDELKREALEQCVGTTGLWWLSSRDGRITLPTIDGIDWNHVSSVVYANTPHEIRSFWHTFPWFDNVWIRDGHGDVLTRAKFPAVAVKTIGDLELRPDGHGNFLFKNPSATPPDRMRAGHREQLVTWLRILIINSGFHLADEPSWFPSRAYSLNIQEPFHKYDWHFLPDEATPGCNLRGRPLSEKWAPPELNTNGPSAITARAAGWGQAVEFLGAIGRDAVQSDLRELQDETGGKVILAGHPALHHGPTLVIAQACFRADRRRADLRFGLQFALCVRQRREHALRQLLDRLHRAETRDPELQAAARARTTRALHARAEGETEYQAIFRYRLAMGALNLRGSAGERLTCPHAWCSTHGRLLTITHVVLDCDAATRVWLLVLRQWTRRSDPIERADLVRSSVGRTAPVPARAIRIDLRRSITDPSTIASATNTVWTIITAVVPHHLWLHRNAAAFNGASENVHSIAAKIWKTLMNQVRGLAAAKRATSATYELGRAISELASGIDADEDMERSDTTAVRLYYDGGSRGNPGVSGAGSLLVERRAPATEWTVVWWAVTYLGTASTNNVAEHTALAHGLEAARERYGTTNTVIDIVGDSMLVTRQLQNRFRATDAKFRPALHRSRNALTVIYAYNFRHTLRAGNKAADWLANYAMDHHVSLTSTNAPTMTYATILTAIEPYVPQDTSHPWSAPDAFHDVTVRLQATARAQRDSLPSRPHKRRRPIALHSSLPEHRPHLGN